MGKSAQKVARSPAATAPARLAEPTRLRLWAASGLLALAVALVYANSLSVPFVFDDWLAIVDNPSVHQLWPLSEVLIPPNEHVAGAIGRPLVNLTLALNYAAGGESAWGYHLFNLVLHALAGLALFGVARRTLGGPVLGARFGAAALPLAWLIALVWLVHPLQTETVTSVVQRTEGQVGLFYWLTLYGFLRASESPRPRWWEAMAVGACLLGAASKELMATAPLIVWLFDRTFVAGSFAEAWRKRRGMYLGLFATWVPLGFFMAQSNSRGQTVGFNLGMSWWSYALKQSEAVTQYLWLTVWPDPLVVDYGQDAVTNISSVAPQLAFIFLLVAGTIYALQKKPVLGFLGAWIFVILAPSSSVVPLTTQTMAEHRMYLPLAAVVAGLVAGIYRLAGRRSLAVFLTAALALGWLTIVRNADYSSHMSLWVDTLKKRPMNERAHYNYGNELAATQREAEAMAEYQKALHLKPDYAVALINAGNILAHFGQLAEAIALYEKALKIDPKLPQGHYNLAGALLLSGQLDAALVETKEALRLDPKMATAHNDFGRILLQQGHPAEAMAEFELAIKLKPGYGEAYFNVGNALAAQGRTAEAIEQFQTSLRWLADPTPARYRLGQLLASSGRLEEAASNDAVAVRLSPNDATLRMHYGSLLYQLKRLPEAVAQYQAALQLKPDSAEAHNNFAAVLANMGRLTDAIAQLEEALRLKPDYPDAQANLAHLQAIQRAQIPGP